MKSNRFATVLSGVALALLASGCSHTPQTESRLDARLAEEPAVATHAELSQRVTEEINRATQLDDRQKDELNVLRKTVEGEQHQIKTESLKLRSILVRDLISPSYDAEEVALIESRLKTLEDRRLSSLFKGVEAANHILGHRTGDTVRGPLLREFMGDRQEARIR
jgi:hypothetical protein